MFVTFTMHHRVRRPAVVLGLGLLLACGCHRATTPQERFQKGLAYYQAGQFARAAQQFNSVVASAPQNVQALNFLGVSQLWAGDVESGIRHLQIAGELDPHFVPAIYNLALASLEQQRTDEAVALLRQVAAAETVPPDTFYYLGVAYLRASAWAQAEDALGKYLLGNPLAVHALNDLGVVTDRLGRPDRAQRYFEECLGIDHNFAPARLNLARLLDHRLGRSSDALTHYRKCLELLPGGSLQDEVRQAIAVREQNLKRPQPASTTGEAAVSTPTPPSPSPSATETVVETTPLPPEPPSTTTPAAESATPTLTATARPPVESTTSAPDELRKRRPPPAARVFRAGDRPSAINFFNQGVRQQQAGDLIEAVRLYSRSIAADPSLASAYYNLAIAYHALGQTEKALEQYETALQANLDYQDARFNYALLLQQQGYLDDAIEQYEKIVTANPAEARAHLSLATLYARNRGTRDQAREHYLAYLKLAPHSPIAREIRRWLDQNR